MYSFPAVSLNVAEKKVQSFRGIFLTLSNGDRHYSNLKIPPFIIAKKILSSPGPFPKSNILDHCLYSKILIQAVMVNSVVPK